MKERSFGNQQHSCDLKNVTTNFVFNCFCADINKGNTVEICLRKISSYNKEQAWIYP